MLKCWHSSIFFVISFCLLCLNELNGQTMTFNPSKDNSLIEKSDGSRSNGSGPLFFVGRVGTMARAHPEKFCAEVVIVPHGKLKA